MSTHNISLLTADPVHPAEGAEAVPAHRGSQVFGLGQEEDRRVRQEVHVQVRGRIQEVATAARRRRAIVTRRTGVPDFIVNFLRHP